MIATVEGDADTLVELYRAEYRSLVRLASVLLDDVPSSEEVVQDAFVQVHRRWDRIADPSRRLAYLRSAVLKGARSRMRRRRVAERRGPASAVRTAASAESDALVHEEHRAVLEAVRRLPDRQRACLVLRYYLDLSEADIAAALGISVGSVKTHTHRGMAALTRQLEEAE